MTREPAENDAKVLTFVLYPQNPQLLLEDTIIRETCIAGIGDSESCFLYSAVRSYDKIQGWHCIGTWFCF